MGSKIKLSEICFDISYGFTASADSEEVGPKFLRITDIQGGVVDWNTVPYCKVDPKSLVKTQLKRGDIVVARTGNSTGENYIFESDKTAVFASYLIRFRVDYEKANPFFVWLQMRTRAWWDFVSGSKSGSAQAGANAKVLGLFEIELPDRNIQDTAVEIAFNYSKKITLNRQINQTLEQMAQALFKSWFVDFDPVIDNALDVGNPIPDTLTERAARRQTARVSDDFQPLPDDVRQLFPHEFEESKLGWIPKGWRVEELNAFGKIITGKTPSKSIVGGFCDSFEGIPFITPSDVAEDCYVINTGRNLTYLGQQSVIKSKIMARSICVTCIGSQMGKTIITEKDAFTNQQINSITPHKPYMMGFLFIILRMRREELFRLGSSGSTMPILNKSDFSKVKILCPTDLLLKEFNKHSSIYLKKILYNSNENKVLASIRDTLLPKLISGELRLDSPEVKKATNLLDTE
jgi:type I restriction enzyme S subunit